MRGRYAGYGKRRAASQRHDLRDAIEAVLAGRAAAEPTGETIGCDIPTLEQGSDAS